MIHCFLVSLLSRSSERVELSRLSSSCCLSLFKVANTLQKAISSCHCSIMFGRLNKVYESCRVDVDSLYRRWHFAAVYHHESYSTGNSCPFTLQAVFPGISAIAPGLDPVRGRSRPGVRLVATGRPAKIHRPYKPEGRFHWLITSWLGCFFERFGSERNFGLTHFRLDTHQKAALRLNSTHDSTELERPAKNISFELLQMLRTLVENHRNSRRAAPLHADVAKNGRFRRQRCARHHSIEIFSGKPSCMHNHLDEGVIKFYFGRCSFCILILC